MRLPEPLLDLHRGQAEFCCWLWVIGMERVQLGAGVRYFPQAGRLRHATGFRSAHEASDFGGPDLASQRQRRSRKLAWLAAGDVFCSGNLRLCSVSPSVCAVSAATAQPATAYPNSEFLAVGRGFAEVRPLPTFRCVRRAWFGWPPRAPLSLYSDFPLLKRMAWEGTIRRKVQPKVIP